MPGIRNLPLLPDDEQPQEESEAAIPGKSDPAVPGSEGVAPQNEVLGAGQEPMGLGLEEEEEQPGLIETIDLGMEQGLAYSPEEVQSASLMVEDIAEKLRPDPIPIPEDSLILMEDNEIARVFEHYLMRASIFRQPFEEGWMEDWLSYFQKVEGEAAKWRSKLAIPLVYEQVNAFVPVLLGAIDTGYVLEVHGMNAEDEQKKKAVQTFLEHSFRVKADGLRKLRDGFWYSALFGTGVWRVFWRYETELRQRPKRVYEMIDGQKVYVGNRLELADMTIADHPDLETVDIWNFFPAPHAIEGDTRIPYVIERIETTPGEVRKLAGSGAYGPEGTDRVDEWLKERPHVDPQAAGVYGQVQSRIDALMKVGLAGPYDFLDASEAQDGERAPLIVYDLWTADYRVTVAGDGTHRILGKRVNPFIFRDCPYVVHNFDRIPKCIFGRGIGSVSGPINRMVNFIYNHAADVAQLQRNAPLVQRKGVGTLTAGQLAWQPGTIIPVRDVNDIKPLEVKDVMRDTLLQEQHLIQHADKAVGVNDLLRGQDLTGTSTATEFAGMQNLTRQRQAAHIREANSSIARLGRLWLSMTQQFVTEEQMIRVAGKDGIDYVQVTPEQVLGEYDVVPAASFVKSNPSLLRADSIALTQIIGPHPLLRQDKWLKYLLKVHEVEHPDEYVMPPPEPPRDPLREEMALNEGIHIDPSPLEDFMQHLMVHQRQYLLLKAEGVNIPAIHAHEAHLSKTLMMLTQAEMTGGPMAPGAAGGGATGPGGEAGGQNEVQRGANREAEAHEGSPGRPPGPAAGGRKNP